SNRRGTKTAESRSNPSASPNSPLTPSPIPPHATDENGGCDRAVQRSQLSPICNSFQVLDATGVADDSAGRKSLNLCEATESMGGRLEVLEVLGAVSGAARHNP